MLYNEEIKEFKLMVQAMEPQLEAICLIGQVMDYIYRDLPVGKRVGIVRWFEATYGVESPVVGG